MDRSIRRQHLEALLEEVSEQKKVDVDQLLMELVHFVIELDDELNEVERRLSS